MESKKPLHILMIEDCEDDAFLITRELEKSGMQLQYTRVDSPSSMRTSLESQPWDLILSDHSMPGFDAPSALQILKESCLDIPFIIVSGSIGEDLAVSAMKAGASDYIRKEQLARLAPAIERESREAQIRNAHRLAEKALQTSEELYRTLVQTSPDAILVCGLNGKIRITNPQTLLLLGFPEETNCESLPNWNQFTVKDSALHQNVFAAIQEQGRLEKFELPVSRADSSSIWVELSGSLLTNSQGKPESILLLLRDITSRKQSEEKIRRQMERLAALRAIDTAITGSLDLHVILRILLDEVTNQLNIDAADVLLVQPNTLHLRYAEGRGFLLPRSNRTMPTLGMGLAGQAIQERRVLSTHDKEEIKVSLGGRTGSLERYSFYLVLPLIAKGQIRGVMEVFQRTPLDPDPEWIGFLETVAEQAAIAIDNASLFDELQRTNTDLTLAYDETIEGWSRALDLRHKESEGHTLRVTEMALQLAKAMEVPNADLIHIRRGSLLHDIGKMEIPDSVLLKQGPLSEEEWGLMRHHPIQAFELLSPISLLRPAMDIPYCHHERYDGSGYPRGLRREQIPLPARIFAIVDVWDTLRTNRPYRRAWEEEQVLSYIRSLEGKQFDPMVLRAFLEQIRGKQSVQSPLRKEDRMH